MFSWYKYLIVSLVFSHLGFWSWSLFLIAPFPDLCLLVLFYMLNIALALVVLEKIFPIISLLQILTPPVSLDHRVGRIYIEEYQHC